MTSPSPCRTSHLFGSRGAADDGCLGEAVVRAFSVKKSLIVAGKIEVISVGIGFANSGELNRQCQGHLRAGGVQPPDDLFKPWATLLAATEPPPISATKLVALSQADRRRRSDDAVIITQRLTGLATTRDLHRAFPVGKPNLSSS